MRGPDLGTGFSALAQGRLGEAERIFRKSLAAGEAPLPLQGLGIVLLQSGKPQQALGFFDRARRALGQAVDPVLLGNRASALAQLGRHQEAAADLHAALAADPDNPVLHYNLGNAHLALWECEAALAAYDEALRRKPDLAVAWKNKGNAAARLFRRELALDCYDRARRLDPGDTEIAANYAAALDILNRREEARAVLEAALALHPDDPLLNFNLGPIACALGDLARGFAALEYRLHPSSAQWMVQRVAQPRRQIPGRRLAPGEDVAGQTVFIHGEQGMGDFIQFARYAALLGARGARVVLETPGPLMRIFQSFQFNGELLPLGARPPRYDCHVPVMSLAYVCGTTLATIPADIPYLAADPARAAEFAQRLPKSDGRKRIGIAWSGNPLLPNDAVRSAALGELAPLADEGFMLVSVQKEIAPRDQDAARAMGVIDLSDMISDFYDTAGLMANLDAVVSVDSAPLHLAGSLGVPGFALLYEAAEWRWMMGREDSPWYPGMRLMRQARAGDWRELAARTAAVLRNP